MKIKYILFDLDGTLTDPKLGITNAVIYALSKFGITGYGNDDLTKFIGPPLKDSFMDFFAFSEEDALAAIGFFRSYFRETGLFENTPYIGIDALLKELKDLGFILAVATSKPTPFAMKILEHFHLIDYFDFVGGSNLDNTRTAKAEVIDYVLENLPDDSRTASIMVGDRSHDVIGATRHNLPCIGVLYGYGTKDELENSGAYRLVPSVGALRETLMALNP